MLKLIDDNGAMIALLSQIKDYSIESDLATADKLISFKLPTSSISRALLQQEHYLQSATDEYVIKEINTSDENFYEVYGKLNLDSLRGKAYLTYETESVTLEVVLTEITTGTGWTYQLADANTKLRTLRLTNVSVYQIIMDCCAVYGAEVWFDTLAKVARFYTRRGMDRGAYVYSELNLLDREYQSDTYDLITRLYPYGKDGLSISSVNGGLEYIDNTQFTGKVVERKWLDDRYTNAQALFDDAVAVLDVLSKPRVSFRVDVLNLAGSRPEYSILDFQLGDTVRIFDKTNQFMDIQRIVRLVEYPITPEKNKADFSNSPIKYSGNSSKQIADLGQILSSTKAELNQAIDQVTALIVNGETGNVVMRYDDQNRPYEILIMDTADIDTASRVWRWNMSGLSFSATGYDGPYTTAITMDGQIVANFITTGTLSADRISARSLTADKLVTGTITAESGVIADLAVTNAKIASVDAAKINSGYISADRINAGSITAEKLAAGSITTDKLAASAITADKIAVGAIVAGSAIIAEGAITSAKIGDAQITTAKIAAGAITNALIETGAIGTAQIADGSITDAKIVDLTANKITAGTLDAGQIDVVNLNAANITVGTINGLQIAGGAIDWSKLASNVATPINTANTNASQAIADALAAATAAGNAQTTAEGKNTVYYQAAQPPTTGRKLGDVWFDTDDGNKMYRWSGSAWVAVAFGSSAIADDAIDANKLADAINTAISTAQTTATNAGTAANTAQTTADGKNKVWYQTTAPTGTAHKVGDTWFDTDDNNQIYHWSGTVWSSTQLGTNAIADAAISNAKIANLDAAKITTGTLSADRIGANSITAAKMAVGTITAASGVLADAVIGTAEIADLAVAEGKIANLAVTNAKIADLSISNAKIADAAIQSAKIASLDAGKITTGTLDAVRIGAGAITANHLAASAVTVDKLAANAVTAVKIAATTITGDKLVASTITGDKIAAATITANNLVAGTITAASGVIADLAITTAKIADANITTAKIADANIINAKIANLAVDAAKIANATITTAKIANLAVTNALIADATIASAKIASLDAGKVTTGILKSANNYSTINLADGTFSFGNGALAWNGSSLTAKGSFEAISGTMSAKLDAGSVRLLNSSVELGYLSIQTAGPTGPWLTAAAAATTINLAKVVGTSLYTAYKVDWGSTGGTSATHSFWGIENHFGDIVLGPTIRIVKNVDAGYTDHLAEGLIGANDYYRITAGGENNNGFLELATADDGTEPIYVRQYTGYFNALVRTAALLDGNGNTVFPGAVYSENYYPTLNTRTIHEYTPVMGAGGYNQMIGGENIHTNRKSGFYMGDNVTNAPNSSWHYYMVQRHNDAYMVVTAWPLNYAGYVWWKRNTNGTWTSWMRINA